MCLYSQRTTNELVDAFRKQLYILSSSTANTWSNPFAFNPIRHFEIWRNSRVIESCLGRELDRRFGVTESRVTCSKKQRKSMLDSALETYNAEVRCLNLTGARTMDRVFRKSAIDQYVCLLHLSTFSY
jgi:hypothetical protein